MYILLHILGVFCVFNVLNVYWHEKGSHTFLLMKWWRFLPQRFSGYI